MAHIRRPRFRRSKEVPPIRITERDSEILRQVYRHRFLRSSQIADLVGGSRQPILRRLQRLFHHGYVERPSCQIDYYYENGSREMVYGLANRGAAYLKHARKMPIQSFDWNEKNRNVRKLFLEHALLVSKVTAAIEVACRAHSNLSFYLEGEMTFPTRTRDTQQPSKWTVSIRGKRRTGVVPDQIFVIERKSDGKPERIVFCLEADRGTMPVVRTDEQASSFAKKLICYSLSAAENIPQRLFGTKRMLVLAVTESVDRLRHLKDAAQSDGVRRGLFLISCVEDFRPSKDPLVDNLWRTPRSEEIVSLLGAIGKPSPGVI